MLCPTLEIPGTKTDVKLIYDFLTNNRRYVIGGEHNGTFIKLQQFSPLYTNKMG